MPMPVLLLTRPRADADRVLSALGPFEGRVIVSPVLRIVAQGGTVPEGAAVILTSAHALEGVTVPAGTVAWCVGDRTAEAARAAGLEARSAGGDAADLIAMIRAAAPKGPLVHLRGEHVAADVVGALDGFDVTERVTYRQEAAPLSEEARAALDGADPVLLPVFSPRSALALRDIAGRAAPRHVVAISPAVAEAAAALDPASVTVAETPDLSGMVRALRRAAASI